MQARRWIDATVAVVWLVAIAATGVATIRAVLADGHGRVFAINWRKRDSFANALQSDLLRHLWLRERFLDLNGGWSRLIGQRRCNGVIRLNNGHLSRPTTPLDTAVPAALMDEFSRYCDELGVRTMFVQCPYKIDPGQTIVPRGAPFDWADRNADSFLAGLRETKTLDLRPLLAGSAADVTRNFFRTDHHWTFGAAFAASAEIARRVLALSGDSDDGVRALDGSRWEKRTFPRRFIGAVGRRTGPWFGGSDEVEYLVPAFRTDLLCSTTRRYGRTTVGSGTFENTLLRREVLAPPSSHYQDTGYSLYGYDRGMVRIENRSAPVPRRIFVVKDSYGTPVVAFLSTVFSEVVAFDLRHWKALAMSDVAAVLRPDAILVLYNPRDLSAKPYFAFWNKGGDSGPPERTVLLNREREVLDSRTNGTERLSLGEGLVRPRDRLCLTVGSATATDGCGAWASVSLVDAATGETFQQDGIACGVATPQRLLFFVPDREGDFRLVFRSGENGNPRGGRIELEGISLERISR